MKPSRTRDIKHAQKASFLFREIAQFFLQITLDDPRLQGLYVNRVKLSPDGGLCTVLFHTSGGKKDFDEKLPTLILYKPSVRSAISKMLHTRYTPELVFAYDEQFEKQQTVNELIDKLKDEGKL